MEFDREPPFTLDEHARQIWDTQLEAGSRAGTLDETDLFLLARYCKILAEVVAIYEWMALNPGEAEQEMISKKGVRYFVKHPKIQRLEKIERQLLPMERALCFCNGARKKSTKGTGGNGQGGTRQEQIHKLLSRDD